MSTLSPSAVPTLIDPPSNRRPTTRNRGDRAFFGVVTAAVWFVPVLVAMFLAVLVVGAWPAISTFGFKFLYSKEWNANSEEAVPFGALPFIYGTVVTGIGALLLAAPIGIAIATFLSEVVRGRVRAVIAFLLEILATIPSVVYGMWGVFVLAPWIAEHVQPRLKIWQTYLNGIFGVDAHRVPNVPIFWSRGLPNGLGLGTAILVLSVMILPLIVSISLDAMRSVPNALREAALGLGATRWEMIRMAVLPPARSGIFGGCILALGRALGETMAVTMIIGNQPLVDWSLMRQAATISSVLANEYSDADGLKLAAMMELALILFLTTLAVNLIARVLVSKPMADGPKSFGVARTAYYWSGLRLLVGLVARIWGAARDGMFALSRVSNAGFRRFKNRAVIAVMALIVVVCMIPLVLLTYGLIRDGGASISFKFLTDLPRGSRPSGGGVGNAIIGTILLLLCGAIFAVPLGLCLGVYLTQRKTTRLASFSRLLLDLLSGIPAILVGVFVYTLVVRGSGFSLKAGFSAIAGALTYAMIMLPIFARSTEEALRAIPQTVDEAGLGLGLARRTVIIRILIRAAMPAILTGLFLALARVGGEAAPLLFTTSNSEFWPPHSVTDLVTLQPLRQPTPSLPMLIFSYSTQGHPELKAQAWGAALTLIFIVLTIRLSTKAFVAWRYGGKETHV